MSVESQKAAVAFLAGISLTGDVPPASTFRPKKRTDNGLGPPRPQRRTSKPPSSADMIPSASASARGTLISPRGILSKGSSKLEDDLLSSSGKPGRLPGRSPQDEGPGTISSSHGYRNNPYTTPVPTVVRLVRVPTRMSF
jgi:hypothetical protein